MSYLDKRHKRMKALAMKVLAVAVQGGRGDDWAAYIDAVKGDNHEREWPAVARDGSKLPYEIAKILFPDFDKLYKWRA